jgi:hypothetical protein
MIDLAKTKLKKPESLLASVYGLKERKVYREGLGHLNQ